ncbi:MAG: preprotein translocase subunit SecA [Candidatus Portiera sp.]|nr:preprotein translocase subunit SecA [Portiera sp.]
MLNKLLTGAFGSRNSRTIKKLKRTVDTINQLEPEISKLSDEELSAKFLEFRKSYEDGTTLEQLLPEAFAIVREGGKRFLNMRHFDAQLMGGLILYRGDIAEMRTGEGKTLMATLPVYLRAIQGEGVHLVTVNDYLAKRDAAWMGKLYQGLGMSVGVIYSEQPLEEKKDAYLADVTYGTNNEFGFDYLRDNLSLREENKVQRSLNFAIVDEVDSILIDEARTPLIISGPRDDELGTYNIIDKLIPPLKRQMVLEDGEVTEEGDFVLDEKLRSVEITDLGHERLEDDMIKLGILSPDTSLYENENIHLLHHLQAALKAHHLFKRNVSYLVQNGKAVIIDEHTGRAMPGRRWSEGIHQAVEAKEGLEVQKENHTMASTTFQNYFRLYDTLAGMTGTADTEAYEFQQTYNLEVVVIPTHKKMIRDDQNDTVYMSRKEKFDAIIEDIKSCIEQERPVLVGTASVESSEMLAAELQKLDLPHNVLNAKNHSREAEVIAEAGRPKAVTIATNMAGRGTDIVLGGNLDKELDDLAGDNGDELSDEQKTKITQAWQVRHDLVIEKGGLHVIGGERHESRRIDNQLRGRSGRQGDPGSSHFYLSLEDDLLRLFTPERVINMMRGLGLPLGEPIEHKMITSAIERAQRKVEGRNFDVRKQLLEYDDVANNQRIVIYEQRNEILAVEDLREALKENIEQQVLTAVMGAEAQADSVAEQEVPKVLDDFIVGLQRNFGINLEKNRIDQDPKQFATLADDLPAEVYQEYENRLQDVDEDTKKDLEKQVMLQVLDKLWRDHIQAMEYVRQGIHLRGYAQRNPKEEYKKEAYSMFDKLLDRIKFDTARILCNLQIRDNSPQYAQANNTNKSQASTNYSASRPTPSGLSGLSNRPSASANTTNNSASNTFTRSGKKVGRNELCPCGTGKKYKHCHGREV